MIDTSIDITPIIGLSVYLWRSKDRPCPCGKNMMQGHPRRGHRAACGQRSV